MAPGDTTVAPGDEPVPLEGAAGDVPVVIEDADGDDTAAGDVPVVLEDADGDDDAVLEGVTAGDAGDMPGDPPEDAGVMTVPDKDGDETGDGTAPAKQKTLRF